MSSLMEVLFQLIDPSLFQRGGRPCHFSILDNFSTEDTFTKLLKENCTHLIRMCGGVVVKWDRTHAKISDKRICLVLGNELDELSLSDFKKTTLKCDLFRVDFVWHSVFSKHMMDLCRYRLLPEAFPATGIQGESSRLYNPNSILNPDSALTWKGVRLTYRNNAEHNQECGDRDDNQCPCVLEPSQSDSEESSEGDVEEAMGVGFDLGHPELFQTRRGKASFILLLDEQQEKEEGFRNLRDAMRQIILHSGGHISDIKLDNPKQDGHAIPIACAETDMLCESLVNLQKNLECDIFGGSFIFETLIAERAIVHLPADLPPDLIEKLRRLRKRALEKHKLTPHYLPHGLYNPDDIMLQKLSWKEVRSVARRTRTHTEYCCTNRNFVCVADEPISDEESENVVAQTASPRKIPTEFSFAPDIPLLDSFYQSTSVLKKNTKPRGGETWRDEETKYLVELLSTKCSRDFAMQEFRKKFPNRSEHGVKLKMKLVEKQTSGDLPRDGEGKSN